MLPRSLTRMANLFRHRRLFLSARKCRCGSYRSTLDAVDANYQATRSALNPRQQVIFDQLSRREHEMTLRSIGQHADGQGTVWQDQQTQAFLDTTSQSATLAAVNGQSDIFDSKIQQGEAAAQHWSQLKGLGDEYGQAKAQLFVGQTVMNAAKQMIDAGQPQNAAAILQQYEPRMDKGSVLAVKGALKGDRRAIEAQQAADDYLNQMNGGQPAGQGQQGQQQDGGLIQQDNRIQGNCPSMDRPSISPLAAGTAAISRKGTYSIGSFTSGDQRRSRAIPTRRTHSRSSVRCRIRVPEPAPRYPDPPADQRGDIGLP